MKHLISLIPGFILAPFSRYFARYSYQNKLDGAIMGVGYAIIFAALFSNPAWNHLKFYTLGPGAAIVLLSMFCPSSSGMSVVIFIIIQIGMFGLAAVYVTISLITAAASSPSYKPSATKATVVVTHRPSCVLFPGSSDFRQCCSENAGHATGFCWQYVPQCWGRIRGSTTH